MQESEIAQLDLIRIRYHSWGSRSIEKNKVYCRTTMYRPLVDGDLRLHSSAQIDTSYCETTDTSQCIA